MTGTVRIEVLGELRVFGPDGEPIALPASRKTKALLTYLALSGRQHLREHLCDLLWDGADDPRGALRWSLSRLRTGLSGKNGIQLIDSDRRAIGLVDDAFTMDFHEAQDAMRRSSAKPSIETLQRVAALFRGDLLEGIDLLESFRFHSWCVAEREQARSLRSQVLTALIDRAPDAVEALRYAHALVSIDPLNEVAHSHVIRLLLQMQRHSDAEAQARTYTRTLEIELGEVPGDVASRLRKLVHSDIRPPRKPAAKPGPAAVLDSLPMVGRTDELATLASWLTGYDGTVPMAVISGEPGVGKTLLMNEVTRGLSSDARVIRGRAYRAENARALGPWRDALADIDGSESVLHSAANTVVEQQQRTQLFDELVTLIATVGSVTQPLVILMDDLQWLDEASVAFLHFLVRTAPDTIALLGSVRPEELIDNPAVGEALESLRKQGAVLQIELPPLAPADIDQLCLAIGEHIDAEQVYDRSEGNPFLATEIARALGRGETELPGNIQHLVATRLQTLSEPARELLPWAAALGRTFHIDILERVTGLDPIALLERVGEIEERGVFEPRETGAYDFSHDLVRDAAYRELSAPRRRIVHRSIARSLDSWHEAVTESSAVEILRHAELGGEAAIACRASVAAAVDALNVCAWVDACVVADRGLQHTAALDAESRLATTLDLLGSRIAAASILGRQHPDHIGVALAEMIELGGTVEQRAHTLYLQSVMQFDNGHADNAERDLVAASEVVRLADPETAARQIANSARCLLYIEADVARARTLVAEAGETLRAKGLLDTELCWAEGLLARWDGDLDQSAEYLLQAIRLAKNADSHWRQSSCLASLIMIASEAGHADRVEELCRGGLVYDQPNGEPLKSPFVEGLAALADFQRDSSSTARLERANEVLRGRGAKSQLSYLLAESARLHADLGNLDDADVAARESVQLGVTSGRVVSRTDALVTIAWVCFKRGDKAGALETLAQAQELAEPSDSVTARVRNRLRDVAAAIRRG